jgi:hypothetical protein
LLIDLLGRHASTEEDSASQVTPMTWISGAHHVLGIKALLSELRDRECTVLLTSTARQWSISHHEEVETRKGNHVHGKLTQIAVKLTWESETARGTADSSCNQVVQISICRCGELESTEADVVQGLIVKSKALISILNKLMHRKSSVVGLNNSIRNLG